jgi:hypothetical protein
LQAADAQCSALIRAAHATRSASTRIHPMCRLQWARRRCNISRIAGAGMPMRRRGCVCGTTSVCSSFGWSDYSGYPSYRLSLARDCRWRRQLDLQLAISRICGSDGRALGMMERRLSSIDGANLTNLDTLRYDRPCLRSLVAASPRSVPCSLAPFAVRWHTSVFAFRSLPLARPASPRLRRGPVYFSDITSLLLVSL